MQNFREIRANFAKIVVLSDKFRESNASWPDDLVWTVPVGICRLLAHHRAGQPAHFTQGISTLGGKHVNTTVTS